MTYIHIREKLLKIVFKILGITFISILALIYAGFLFVLPRAIDLNQYMPDVQKAVKKATDLNLTVENPKVSVSPLLQAGIKTGKVEVKLPDNSTIAKTDGITARISLPALLFMTIKVSEAKLENLSVNLDIENGSEFKAIKLYESILDKQENDLKAETSENPFDGVIDISKIKILVPALKITNYNLSVNDLDTKEHLKLCGDNLIMAYRNGKTAAIKTNAKLILNSEEKISANIDIDTLIPPISKLDEEDDKPERVDIPFINPIEVYKNYNLQTNINSKIRIRNNNGKLTSNGYFNIDDFTLNLSGIQLPKSMFHLNTKGQNAFVDLNLFITDKEKLNLNGKVNYSKKPSTNLNFNSDKIQINNILNLVRATLDSFHIRNELYNISADGELYTNAAVKTNFKKLKSNGEIVVSNCRIKNIAENKDLFKLNSIISFENNTLNFKDTIGEIAETQIKIDGGINDKSYTDIFVGIKHLPLSKFFKLLMTKDLNRQYNVNSGEINLDTSVTGEMKNAAATVNFNLLNTSLNDVQNKIVYTNKLLSGHFKTDFKKLTGGITNDNFNLEHNNATVGCSKFELNIDENNVIISPSKLNINNATNIDFYGGVYNYTKNPQINFSSDGLIRTQDIKQFVGKEIAFYLQDKGLIRVSMDINGDKKKQTLNLAADANKSNFITPINIENIKDRNTTLRATVDFKGDRLKIKDTGLFIKTLQTNSNGNVNVKLDEVLGIDGTITQLNTNTPNINLIKVSIPNKLRGNISIFPQSAFEADGRLFAFGSIDNPHLRGNFNIFNLAIPELMLNTEKVSAKFEGKNIDLDINNLVAAGSDYNVQLKTDINPSDKFMIKGLNVTSSLTDADKLTALSTEAMKFVPPSDGTAQADIPVEIRNGKAAISQIKTGNITLNNTTSNFTLHNNLLSLNNVLTNAFEGRVTGNILVDLLTLEIKAKLNGTGLNVEKTLAEAAGMKDTLSGTMNFDTELSIKGTTMEEQMKSLKGSVNFNMLNGQLGPFGRIENLIMAENIRESSFFQSTIGSIINSMLSFNTTKYNILSGHIDFDNGIAKINPITSSGDIMATYIFGDFDLLQNKIDIKLRGRLGSQVSDSMGPLAYLNPVNLIKATPGMSLVLGKIFFLFTEQVTNAELAQIPQLGKDISDNNSTKFQVVLRGDAAKPLTLVKSFKWLALESDILNAQQYVQKVEEEEAARQAEEAARAAEEAKPQIVKEKDKAVKKYKEIINSIKSKFSKKEVVETE